MSECYEVVVAGRLGRLTISALAGLAVEADPPVTVIEVVAASPGEVLRVLDRLDWVCLRFGPARPHG